MGIHWQIPISLGGSFTSVSSNVRPLMVSQAWVSKSHILSANSTLILAHLPPLKPPGHQTVWPTRSPKHSGGPQMGKMKLALAAALGHGARLMSKWWCFIETIFVIDICTNCWWWWCVEVRFHSVTQFSSLCCFLCFIRFSKWRRLWRTWQLRARNSAFGCPFKPCGSIVWCRSLSTSQLFQDFKHPVMEVDSCIVLIILFKRLSRDVQLKPDPQRCGSLRMGQCDNPAHPGRRDPVLMSNPS